MSEAEFLSLDPEDRDGLIDEAVWGLDRTANTDQRRWNALCSKYGVGNTVTIRKDGQAVTSATVDFARGLRGLAANPDIWLIRNEGPDDVEGCWPWDQRIGKPWQAVMERDVAAWRAPSSKKWTRSNDAALEIFKDHLPDTCSLSRWRDTWRVRNFNWIGAVHAEAAVAICLAALKVVSAIE